MMRVFLLIAASVLAYTANATPSIDTRIIGGYEAKTKEFPFAAALFLDKGTDKENFCGGSLISPDFVLTAAHCTVSVSQITVVLGSVGIDEETPGQVVLNSTEFIVPKEYNASTYDWDLALIKLPEPVELSDYIQPITLAEGDNSYAGDMAVVVGWGIQWGGQTTYEPNLRYIGNIILSNRQCVKNDPTYKGIVLESHICQSTLGYRGACHGDSGGALEIDNVQVGIVSLGFASCFHEMPVVFTRITSFREWIKENSGV